MNLLAPISLFFLLSIPVVVLLYLLRLRRKELVVSSTLLWQHMTQDIQANAPFQRLRKNILLLLQIIILALLAFALARPFLRVHALSAESTVIILDTSASMQSTDARGSRLEAAKREAARMIEDMSRDDRVMVLAAGAKTRVMSHFTSDKRALKAAVNAVQPTDTETHLRDAVMLGVSLAAPGQASGADIYIMSDGAFEPLEDIHLGAARLHFVKFGSRSDNVALTALDVRRSFARQVKDQILVTVANFGEDPRDVDLEMYNLGSLFDVRQLTIPAGQSKSVIFEDFGFDSGVIEARLDVDDDLAVDNSAYGVMAPRQRVSVLLVTKENVLLEKVLNAHPDVELAKTTPGGYGGAEYDADVLIFDENSPQTLPTTPALLIAATTQGAPVELLGKIKDPTILDWERRHPVTKYVDFADVQIHEAKIARLLPWGRPLVKAGGTPLVVVGERGESRCVYVGMPLRAEATDFVWRVGFPILISNALGWLARGAERENVQFATGSVVDLEAEGDADKMVVKTPAGEEVEVEVPPGQHSVPFDQTEQAGVYRATCGERETAFAANLLSRAESNTQPGDTVSVGREELASTGGQVTANREVWRLLALVAVFILSLEWYIYHRRI
ncbi:MAG: VWA domain-containing protein [Armatimonadota bacterium]